MPASGVPASGAPRSDLAGRLAKASGKGPLPDAVHLAPLFDLMTSHMPPAAVSRQSDWEQGISFEAFLEHAQENCDLWTNAYRRATPPDDQLARLDGVAGTWRLLALSADWCLDATATVSPLAAFVDAAPNLELRHLDRDEHLDLMDEHLTNGRARSIPVVIVLDETGAERAWWGPRPADLQAWFESSEAQALPKEERYRELRKWYARDRGRTTITEIVSLIEQAAGGPSVA